MFMKIRRFVMEDYDAVYVLWQRTAGMGLNDIDDSREGIAKYLARNPTTFLVAEAEEAIVGVIMSGHDGRRGYIHHTCVAQELWCQGVGSALVGAALNALKAEGISKSALVVFGKNDIGNAFWQRRGFAPRPDLVYRDKALTTLKRMDT